MIVYIGVVINLCIIVGMYYGYQSLTRGNDGILLNCHFNIENIDNEAVRMILKEYKSNCLKVLLIGILWQVLGLLALTYISLFFPWVLFSILIPYVLFVITLQKSSDKLQSINEEHHWNKVDEYTIVIDTTVSRLKDSYLLKIDWLLYPIPIFILLLAISYYNFDLLYFVVLLVEIISGYCVSVFGYIVTKNTRSKVYSDDVEINMALNKSCYSKWSSAWVILCYSLFILFLVALVTSLLDLFILFILITVVYTSTVSLWILFHTKKAIQTDINLLVDNKNIIVKNYDQFWKYGFYNNPYDPKVWVDKRIGVGSTINIATLKGKIYYGIGLFIVIFVLIFNTAISLPYDISSVDVEINANEAVITFGSSTYQIAYDNIDSIDIIDTLPDMSKKVGGATNRVITGSYNVEGYGTSEVYLMRAVEPYIIIKNKDESNVLVNTNSSERTIELYHSFLEKLD